jgi:hypothetical protein
MKKIKNLHPQIPLIEIDANYGEIQLSLIYKPSAQKKGVRCTTSFRILREDQDIDFAQINIPSKYEDDLFYLIWAAVETAEFDPENLLLEEIWDKTIKQWVTPHDH